MIEKTVSGNEIKGIIITAIKEIDTKKYPYFLEDIANLITDYHVDSQFEITGKAEFVILKDDTKVIPKEFSEDISKSPRLSTSSN